MIMPGGVRDPEADRHAIEEGGLGECDRAGAEIVADVEQQLIHARA